MIENPTPETIIASLDKAVPTDANAVATSARRLLTQLLPTASELDAVSIAYDKLHILITRFEVAVASGNRQKTNELLGEIHAKLLYAVDIQGILSN